MDREIGPPEGTPIEEIHCLAALAQLLDAVQAGVDAGEFASTDTEMLAMTYWGGVHGVVALTIEQQAGWLNEHMLQFKTDQVVTCMIDALTRGMEASPSSVPH